MPVLTDNTLETLPVQYGDGSGYVTHDERDAQSATYFTPNAEVILSLVRSPRGKWMYNASDHCRPTRALERRRWDSPAAALHGVARHMGFGRIAVVEL